MTQTLPTPPTTRIRTRRNLAVGAYAAALVAWSAVIGIPNDPIGISLWIWLFTFCWRPDLPAREHLRFARDWAPWLLALAAYGLIRGLTDDLGFAPHVTAPIRADEWLAEAWGGETVPTVSLQLAWCGDPCPAADPAGWWDVLVSTVYASHFVVGLTIAGVLWLRNRALWLEWIRRYVTISYLALVGYIVYPMAPPWMAARDGLLPELGRISSRGFHALGIERTTMVFGGLANKTAAMPSLHAGITFLVAFYAVRRLRERLALPGAALPARDVAGAGLLGRALPDRRDPGCRHRSAGDGHRLMVGPASAT